MTKFLRLGRGRESVPSLHTIIAQARKGPRRPSMTPSTPLIADTLERTSSRLTNHVSNFLALCGLDGVMSIQYAFSQLWLVTQPKCGARPPYADRQKYYSVGNKRQKKVEYLSLDLLSALARLARKHVLTESC